MRTQRLTKIHQSGIYKCTYTCIHRDYNEKDKHDDGSHTLTAVLSHFRNNPKLFQMTVTTSTSRAFHPFLSLLSIAISSRFSYPISLMCIHIYIIHERVRESPVGYHRGAVIILSCCIIPRRVRPKCNARFCLCLLGDQRLVPPLVHAGYHADGHVIIAARPTGISLNASPVSSAPLGNPRDDTGKERPRDRKRERERERSFCSMHIAFELAIVDTPTTCNTYCHVSRGLNRKT